MDKEKLVPFPWSEDQCATDTNNHPEMTTPWYIRLRVPVITICTVLILMYLNIGTQKKPTAPNEKNHSSIVLVPVIAIGKGEKLNPQFLKSVEVSHSKLTKSQRLNLLLTDDLNKIDGKIYAKRSLPPYRPIFWNHLDYKDSSKAKSVQVLYGN